MPKFVSFASAVVTRPDGRMPDFDVLILGGRPIREPVAHYGPFVMNTREDAATQLGE